MQIDRRISVLTVEENIYFAAKLKLPNLDEESLQERVLLMLEMTGLESIRDSFVGDSLHKGISGGQLKRLSLAIEIVALPDLIFLGSLLKQLLLFLSTYR